MGEDHYLNLQPGTIVNGRYEIVKCLGAGSMGMVYACRHRELAGHLVAMKVLFSEVARDSVAAARFRNEIVASYGVSHPNVVRAYEYFRDGDLIAFTMEYIGGGDLADRISTDQPMPIEETVRMLSQMCSGVQAIHEAGIVHRDLKPENILITTQGDIKITDFGIARTGTGPKLTEHGGVVGTIDYVSPEYLERGQVDARSDIYALGVLAYEMLTGESPFKGKSVIETMTMRLRTDPEPPATLRPDCPAALSNIVLKAMARDPEKRYQSASEMRQDLVAMNSTGGLASFYAARREAPASAVALPASAGGELAVGGVSGAAGTGGRQVGDHLSQTEEEKRPGDSYLAAGATGWANTGNPLYYGVERLESVLRRDVPNVRFPTTTIDNGGVVSTVTVAQGHLSPDRMKRLSSQMGVEQGFFRRYWWAVALLFVAFVTTAVAIKLGVLSSHRMDPSEELLILEGENP